MDEIISDQIFDVTGFSTSGCTCVRMIRVRLMGGSVSWGWFVRRTGDFGVTVGGLAGGSGG